VERGGRESARDVQSLRSLVRIVKLHGENPRGGEDCRDPLPVHGGSGFEETTVLEGALVAIERLDRPPRALVHRNGCASVAVILKSRR